MGDILGVNSDNVEKTVYTALDDSCEISDRDGRWSSLPEVSDYANLDKINTKDTLNILIKKNLAEEKIAASGRNLGLFRPTKLGAASYDNSFPFDDKYGQDLGQKGLDGGKNKGDNGKNGGKDSGKKDGVGDEFDKSKVPQGKNDPLGDPFDPGTDGGKNEGNNWGKPDGGGNAGEDNFPNFKLPKKHRKNTRPKGKMKPAWDDSKPKHNGGGSEPSGDGLGFPKGAMKGLGKFGKPEIPIKNTYEDPKIPLINPDDYQEYNQKPFKGPIPEPSPLKPNTGEKVGQDVGNMASQIITSALFGGAMGGMSSGAGVSGGMGRIAMPMRHQRKNKKRR